MRAVTALVVAPSDRYRRSSSAALRANWSGDDQASRILKAVSGPIETSDFPAAQSTVVLPMLAPASASSRLFALGAQLSLDGIATVKLPYISGAGRPASTPFVGEGQPGPVFDLNTSATTLGPTCKMLIQAAVSPELQSASAGSALAMIEQALAISAELSMDSALFGANPATPDAPPGILNGVTSIPSVASESGAEAVAEDIGALAAVVAANGVGVDDMVIVTTPKLATKLRVLASPLFSSPVMSSAALPDGTVIGIVPRGFATGYSGPVQVEVSNAAAVHYEDAAPLPIVNGEPAVPARSAFQQDLIVLKLRARAAWCVQPGAIAVIENAKW